MKRNVLTVGIFGICVALGALFFILPSLGGSVFLSPDETANAVSARAFAAQGSMRIEDKILTDGPWLRPRSFVTQDNAIVPVGFLGLSFTLGIIRKILGEWGMMLAVPLLALSAVYPLWKFTERFGRVSQVLAVITWLSFPTVVLYANRGLFPNLPAVCLTLWSAYLLWNRRTITSILGAGFLAGLALAIRPTEVLWILPWLWLAWMLKKDDARPRWQYLGGILAAAIPMVAAFLVSWKTYGSPFVIGYGLRDAVVSSLPDVPATTTAPTISHLWPFGFHPKNVLFNVESYVSGLWGAWTIVALASAALWVKEKVARPAILVALWTFVVSALLYGQAIYQDHVGVNVVSTGNSFLRYMLPLAPIFVVAAAAFYAKVAQLVSSKYVLAIPVLISLIFIALGLNLLFRYDNENVYDSGQELRRYTAIHDTAFAQLGGQAIILSDRSDKIFFPTFRVASPLPAMSDITDLVQHVTVPVALYSTTLDQRGFAPWTDAGLRLVPVFTSENQTMYLIQRAK